MTTVLLIVLAGSFLFFLFSLLVIAISAVITMLFALRTKSPTKATALFLTLLIYIPIFPFSFSEKAFKRSVRRKYKKLLQ